MELPYRKSSERRRRQELGDPCWISGVILLPQNDWQNLPLSCDLRLPSCRYHVAKWQEEAVTGTVSAPDFWKFGFNWMIGEGKWEPLSVTNIFLPRLKQSKLLSRSLSEACSLQLYTYTDVPEETSLKKHRPFPHWVRLLSPTAVMAWRHSCCGCLFFLVSLLLFWGSLRRPDRLCVLKSLL